MGGVDKQRHNNGRKRGVRRVLKEVWGVIKQAKLEEGRLIGGQLIKII